jgi:hypothetical protein
MGCPDRSCDGLQAHRADNAFKSSTRQKYQRQPSRGKYQTGSVALQGKAYRYEGRLLPLLLLVSP